MIRKILVFEVSLADKHPALERALALHASVELKVEDVAEGPSDSLRELHRQMLALFYDSLGAA